MNNYRYAGIETYDINNGKGFGVTLFVQGCPHKCQGCHNPQTWDFNGGKSLSSDVINELVELFKNKNIKRLTISGGEPFSNYEVTYSISSLFKEVCKEKQLWIYTGYSYEEVQSKPEFNPVLALCDVMVDGPFQLENRDLSLPFRGSSNQRIIDVQKSLATNSVALYEV